jgi:hypothetical protein
VASATLLQCVATGEQAEHSATFAGEMTAIPGTARMQMRIEVLERTPGQVEFHPVIAPGFGVWRSADPGVKTYKYIKQVTNLPAPAAYQAAISFRWQRAKGHLLKSVKRHTSECVQRAAASSPSSTTPPTPTTPGSTSAPA